MTIPTYSESKHRIHMILQSRFTAFLFLCLFVCFSQNLQGKGIMYFLRTLWKSNKREKTDDVKGEINCLISRKKQELTMVSCATEQNEEIQKIMGRAT